jgi:ABC-type sugar transport system substrate-binding protein
MSKQFLRCALPVIAATAGLLAAGCGSSDSTSGTTSGTASAPAPAAASTQAASTEVSFETSAENGLPTSYPEPKPQDLTIGLLNPLGATEVLRVEFDAAKKRVAELGGKSIELDNQGSADKQVSQFEQLINQHVDAIGIYPIARPELLAPLLKRAAKEGIPVVGSMVTPGVPKPVPGFASQVWHQRDRLIYLQAKAAAEALGPGAKVATIGLAIPAPLWIFSEERTKYWLEQFGLDVVASAQSQNDTVEGGQEAAAGLLANHPDIEGIIGYNDEGAIGGALAARAAGRDVQTFGILAGTLGRGAIENGRLTTSVFMDAADDGRKLVDGLYDAAQGVKIPPVVLTGDPYIVTKDNVGDVQP